MDETHPKRMVIYSIRGVGVFGGGGGNKIFGAEEIKRGSKNSALKGGYDKKWGWANKDFWCQGYQQIFFDFQKNTTAPHPHIVDGPPFFPIFTNSRRNGCVTAA